MYLHGGRFAGAAGCGLRAVAGLYQRPGQRARRPRAGLPDRDAVARRRAGERNGLPQQLRMVRRRRAEPARLGVCGAAQLSVPGQQRAADQLRPGDRQLLGQLLSRPAVVRPAIALGASSAAAPASTGRRTATGLASVGRAAAGTFRWASAGRSATGACGRASVWRSATWECGRASAERLAARACERASVRRSATGECGWTSAERPAKGASWRTTPSRTIGQPGRRGRASTRRSPAGRREPAARRRQQRHRPAIAATARAADALRKRASHPGRLMHPVPPSASPVVCIGD